MHVLLLNGSPNAEGCTFTALSEIAATLKTENISRPKSSSSGKSPYAGAWPAASATNAANARFRTMPCPRSSMPRSAPTAS